MPMSAVPGRQSGALSVYAGDIDFDQDSFEIWDANSRASAGCIAYSGSDGTTAAAVCINDGRDGGMSIIISDISVRFQGGVNAGERSVL